MRYLNKIIEYGVLLFVFLIPWQARWIIKSGELNGGYWEYGTASLYATEVLLGLILVAMVVKGAVWFKRNHPRFHWRRLLSPVGVLLLFLTWTGFSIFWAIDKGAAFQHWVFLILAISLFVILAYGVPSPFKGEGRVRVGGAIIFSASIQAAIALIQFFSQSIPGSTIFGMSAQSASTLGASVVETVNGRWLRAYGTFPHPNILGGWLVLGLLVWFTAAKKYAAIIKWSAFVVILSGLLVTFSRSSWLALVIGLLVMSLRGSPALREGRGRNDKGILQIIVVTILTITLFIALFPEPFLARLISTNRLEIKSSAERTASLSQSWQIIKKYPLTGVGLGNYGLAVHKYIDNKQPAWFYQPAHNVFLLIWSEMGLIGILFIGLLVYWFIGCGRRWSRFETIIYLLPLAVLSLFDHYLWSLYPGMMMAAAWLSLTKNG